MCDEGGADGAPLGGVGEFDPANYRSIDANGTPVIPVNSHIRLASAESLNGIKILRRGFNFVAGSDGSSYIIMEYVGGQSLNNLLKSRMKASNGVYSPIPLDQAAQGYREFDEGAARKYVIDPHGMIRGRS